MALPPNRPVAFSAGAARKIKQAVHRINATPRSNDRRPARGGPWTYGVVRAKVSTVIPSGSFASPSDSGEAQIYHKDSAGDWVASGEPVSVKNQFGGGSIAVDSGVLIAWIGGEWFVVAADCPPEE